MIIPPDIKAILYKALEQPIGLLIHVSDPDRGIKRLYQTRAALKDPALADIQIRANPGLAGGNLIIVNKRVKLGKIGV